MFLRTLDGVRVEFSFYFITLLDQLNYGGQEKALVSLNFSNDLDEDTNAYSGNPTR